MLTKTIRSQFSHGVGEMVEGFVIREKHTVIPPVPVERRRGVYDYLVEVAPIPIKGESDNSSKSDRSRSNDARREQTAWPSRSVYLRAYGVDGQMVSTAGNSNEQGDH